MAAIAGNLGGIPGIFTVRATVLSVVIHHAITGRMGALLNLVRHDRFSPLTDQGNWATGDSRRLEPESAYLIVQGLRIQIHRRLVTTPLASTPPRCRDLVDDERKSENNDNRKDHCQHGFSCRSGSTAH
jgi:hypothetical protein